MIGGRPDFAATSFFNGRLDEVRFTRKALYTGPFTPPSAPFALSDVKPFSVRVELESQRDGVVSYQKHSHTTLIV